MANQSDAGAAQKAAPALNVLITGGTGFVGTALVSVLLENGYNVSVLTRDVFSAQKVLPPEIKLVTRLNELPSDAAAAGVINLAGANLAAKRWSPAYKSQVLASRINLTERLVEWCADQASPPACLISASAIGYYGDRADEVLTEDSAGGLGFGHALCRDWEKTALKAEALGVRVCLARLGVVMDAKGGAFSQMLLPYRFKVGVTLGNGQNWLSWIHRADAVKALYYLLTESACSGVYNLCAPEPVRVADFSAQLRHYWPVFAKFSAPAFLLKIALGEFAPEVLLASQRVQPARLQAAGFQFSFSSLDSLLSHLRGV